MNIDLVYYFREVNHYYYLNGPEKVNGNIVNNSPAYQLSTANDVVTKINQMVASLAPDITNVGLVTSELYTGNIQVNTYRGELNVSSAPDYTNILISINTNLTNLNEKFVYSGYSIADIMRKIFMSVVANCSLESLDINLQRNSVGTILHKILSSLTGAYQAGSSSDNSNTYSYIKQLVQNLKQSVSPNANITDVISALNSNIHNDLTNINTTENNKDTVLIIDGQQEFKLHKDDE